MVMKRVGILYHPLKEATNTFGKKLEAFLSARGLAVWLASSWEWEKTRSQMNDTDLILSVGGDGTILRAAQVVIPTDTPITGINMGRFGFMTELTVDEAMEKLPALLAGDGWIDERCLLEAELSTVDGGTESAHRFYALNDAVVARGAAVRLIHVEVSIDGTRLSTYQADGVIAATATGSTSYALAAGGPILHPQAEESLLVPITPHLGTIYPMVISPGATVQLHLISSSPAVLCIDGHINTSLTTGATITVKHSAKKVRFLRSHPKTSFYGSLEQKLKGKQ
ncbi:MAG: NAD(+)/NADH kinase [Dehalococcoidales bacterium]|nr:NAD(+)/NADH kinase [Dehalococcoidales bacterium]